MTEVKKQRSVSPDFLRIISMLLIVFLHSIDHSGVLENAESCGIAMYLFVRFTYALCMVCVNIYVMLSGYFMLNSKFRLHKLVTLWMEAAFYAFVLKLVFMLIGKEPFSVVSLAGCLFPILTGRYWFLTIYVGMYLISPFLNILIRSLNQKQHSLLNIVLFVLFSLWASIHPSIAGMNSGGGWGLAWFVVLYITAAWFRLYYKSDNKPLLWLCGYVALGAIVAVAYVVADKLGIDIIHAVISNWFRYNSAPVYIMTICIFVGFLNIQINGSRISKVICFIASYTFGVYLIHAHANVSPWIWYTLALPEKMVSFAFVLIQLGCVLAIFVVCVVIDILRKLTLGALENSGWMIRLCDNFSGWVQKQFRALF